MINTEKKPIVRKVTRSKFETKTNSEKRERIPFRKQKRIGIERKDGIYTRLVNDDGDRIDRFIKAGFTVREKAPVRDGQKDAADSSQFCNAATQVVDRSTGMVGYYMDIPESVIQEDIDAKDQETIDLLNEIGMRVDIPQDKKAGKVKITLSGNTEVKDEFKNSDE